MTIRTLLPNFNQTAYNKLAIHPLQCWQWGKARIKMGIETVRVGEFDNAVLKNVYQFTLHPIPHTKYKIGYLPRSIFPTPEILKYMFDYGKKNNVIFFKIEPYVQKSQVTNIQKLHPHLVPSPHPLFTPWTQTMEINKTEETLLRNMKQKTRYNIRLAQKKGVEIKEESTDKGFKVFSKLYFETCKRQRYFGHTPEYHKIVWDFLKDGIAHILIAYYEDQPLAAYELFYFHDTLYYPYGGSSVDQKSVMAPNLIMWEAIRLGKKLGAKQFDMWGSLPPGYSEKNPWAGFTRFKEGYGAKFTEMIGSFDLIIQPNAYKVYNVLHKIRSVLLWLKP